MAMGAVEEVVAMGVVVVEVEVVVVVEVVVEDVESMTY